MDAPLGTAGQDGGRDVLRGQRHAEAAPARLRAGGLPQPRRLQRLPAALGRERRRSRRWRCGATTRRWRDEFMALDTVDVKQSRAVKKNLAPASGGTTHRAGPILEDSVPIDTRLSAAVRPGDQHARLLRVQGMAPHRADGSRGGGVGDGVGQHAAAGVRVAAAERRHAAAVRHLRGRRRSQAGRRDAGRERRRHHRRQHPQRAGTVRGPDRRQRRRARPRVELRRHQGDLRGAAQRDERPGSVAARRRRAGPAASSPATAAAMANGVRVHNFDPVFAPDGSVVFASTRAGTLDAVHVRCPTRTCIASGPASTSRTPSR